jgi:hypothetical protein
MQDRVRTALLALVTTGLVGTVIWLAPARIVARADLSTCYWSDPIVVLDGRQIPVSRWPDGMSWDWNREAVVDAAGTALFHKGDRISIDGRFVTVHGDPSPCFQTRTIRLDQIEPADPGSVREPAGSPAP